MPRYTVTYVFDDARDGDDVTSRIDESVARLRRDGIDVEVHGIVLERDSAGSTLAVTARFTAPNEGTIGLLNWRAGLPASGPPRRDGERRRSERRRYVADPP